MPQKSLERIGSLEIGLPPGTHKEISNLLAFTPNELAERTLLDSSYSGRPSALQQRIVWLVVTIVSEEHATSIFVVALQIAHLRTALGFCSPFRLAVA
jgi:hypothetical protein